jgi:transposase-like protein
VLKSVIDKRYLKTLMADLKRIYVASTEEIARLELDAFEERWDNKYHNISKSWRED